MSHKRPLHIIVMEGPAGSGKSTAITRGLQLGVFNEPIMLAEVPRPRQYVVGPGTNLSQVKDYLRTIGALAIYQVDDSKPVVFDRWAVSQYVYHCIRLNVQPDPLSFWYGYMSQNFTNFLGAACENLWRHELSMNLALEREVFMDFYFILPSIERLEAARSRRGPGHYPYNLMQEVSTYSRVMDAFEDYHGFDQWKVFRGINIRVQQFPSYLPMAKLDKALKETRVLS